MSQTTTTRTRPRTVAIVVAGFLGLAALMSLAIGGAAMYGQSHKDDDGYLSTDTHRLATDRSAIATDDLDIDAGGSGWLVDSDSYGNVRVRAESNDGKPVFVGIARSGDVEDYLAGKDHATLTDVDFHPFDADYDDHRAARSPAPPATQDIWAASAQGTGRQAVTWDVENGSWSVVVMNADGSAGVDAGVSAGAEVSFLDEVAWAGIAAALLAALAAAGVLVLDVRRQRS
jgi:hypothetical protein